MRDLIFYSAYSRSENDARIEKSARLIFTPNHPGPYIYARNTRRRGQSPLRINDSRINGHRRAIDAEFRICCAESDLLTARSRVFASNKNRNGKMQRFRAFILSFFFSSSQERLDEKERGNVSGNKSPPKNNYSYRCVNKRLPIYGRCKHPSPFLFRQRVIRLSVNRPRGRE